MNPKYLALIKKRFNDLPEKFKLVLYRNPNEFIYHNLFLEYINPTHIITIWGLPKRPYRKTNYTHYIMVGKILLSICTPFVSLSWYKHIDYMLYLTSFISSVFLINYFMFIIDIFSKPEVKTNVNRHRGRTRWGKNPLAS